MKIAHFADVHFRGLARHDEYRRAFEDAFRTLRINKPDMIYIGGDIVHSKTQGITPELIDNLTWWFTSLQEIAPTYVILGNHDGLIFNKNRQDAISPIISAINSDRIILLKKSGVYDCIDPKFKLCNFSLFDEKNWDCVKPANGFINIALYHGSVRGAVSDLDYELEGEITVNFFEKFHFAFLGDIHKRQFLNSTRTIAYCGSSIQQNYGEEVNKGYLLWDIRSEVDFDVNFISIKNDRQHHTITWSGDLENDKRQISLVPKKSRVRIEVNSPDVYGLKQFQGVIESEIDPCEVTFKSVSLQNVKSITKEATSKINIRKSFENFVEARTQSDSIKQKCMQIVDNSIQSFGRADKSRNVKWDLNKIEFNNLFAYGEDNVIDFKKLPGITGIFGKNRHGKSSIIGAITYALFNTTDRGSLKNLHVINSKKNDCSANISITLGHDDYEITRASKKNFPKNADVWASTTLSITKNKSEQGSIDLNDEQRRETEKILRSLIGTSDDFFYTCLASQGQMNTFIMEKSSSRKQMLSRFLDVDYFEESLNNLKAESASYRHKIKSLGQNTDFESQIQILKSEILKSDQKKMAIQQKLSGLRSELSKLVGSGDHDFVTQEQLDMCEKVIKQYTQSTKELLKSINEKKKSTESLTVKLDKVKVALSKTSFEDLTKECDDAKNVSNSIQIQKKDKTAIQREIDISNKSIELLSRVPCEGKFPTCEFICDAYKQKQNLPTHIRLLSEKERSIDILLNRYESLKEDDPNIRLQKYQKMNELEHAINMQLKENEGHKSVLCERLKSVNIDLTKKNDELKKYQRSFDKTKANEAKVISDLKLSIATHDKDLLNIAIQEGKFQERLDSMTILRDEVIIALQEITAYDIVEDAFSKKGVPSEIISSSLPIINSEISRLLDGIAGFNIEIVNDDNCIDIYLDYGDSRRLLELGSGMEKLIASIVIRVALTNISELPKPSMFIIDEGFGTLDDSNIEACAKLMINLKSEFRNIILISHVDAIKDVVDNIIDIEWKDGYASVQC